MFCYMSTNVPKRVFRDRIEELYGIIVDYKDITREVMQCMPCSKFIEPPGVRDVWMLNKPNFRRLIVNSKSTLYHP